MWVNIIWGLLVPSNIKCIQTGWNNNFFYLRSQEVGHTSSRVKELEFQISVTLQFFHSVLLHVLASSSEMASFMVVGLASNHNFTSITSSCTCDSYRIQYPIIIKKRNLEFAAEWPHFPRVPVTKEISCNDWFMLESVTVGFDLDQGPALLQTAQAQMQPTVFVNKVLEEHRHTHLFIFSLWLLQRQRWIVKETVWFHKA